MVARSREASSAWGVTSMPPMKELTFLSTPKL
jgi:hypothetical protein